MRAFISVSGGSDIAQVTFRLSGAAYEIIREEAAPRDVASSTLPRGSRAALAEAAQLTDGVWVVDCPEEVSREIEHWFQQAAALESATPGGDEGRFVTLADAVRAIRDGRMKSGRERGAR